MIDNLKRIREPLTWAVIVLVAANLVLGIVQLVQQVRQAVPLFEAFQSLGGSAMSISLVIAVVALVSTCFFIAPATGHARLVTLVAAIVLSVGVLLTLVSYVLGAIAADDPFGRVVEIIGSLIDLLLKGVGAGALWVLLRGVTAGRIDTAPPAPVGEETSEDETGLAEPDVPQPRTTWQRSEAAGAVWQTADDAAAGAPGASRMPESRPPAIFRDEAGTPADSE